MEEGWGRGREVEIMLPVPSHPSRNSILSHLIPSHLIQSYTRHHTTPSQSIPLDISSDMGCLKVVPCSHLCFKEGVGHGDVSRLSHCML